MLFKAIEQELLSLVQVISIYVDLFMIWWIPLLVVSCK